MKDNDENIWKISLVNIFFICWIFHCMYKLRSQARLKIETYMNLKLEIKQLYSFTMI